MASSESETTRLTAEIDDLRARLDEALETLRAIRAGEVDALVVLGPEGEQVYTLKGADQAYHVMVEAMNEAAIILDHQGVVFYSNGRLAEMLKRPAERLVGASLEQYITPEFRSEFRGLLERCWQEPCRQEIMLLTDDGTRVPAVFSAQPLTQDNVRMLCVIITDLTEHKKAEETILESESNLRRIVETATEGVSVLDNSGISTYCNKQFASMLGYTPGEIIGKPLLNFIDPEDREELAYRRKRRAQGIREAYELRYRHKDGHLLWGLVSAAPVNDKEGKFIGSLALVTDITERKQIQEEMKGLRLRLLEAQETERRAVARELHDETAQYLTVLRMQLGRIKNAPAEISKDAIEKAMATTGDLIHQIRDLSMRLRPSILDDLGLIPALAAYMQRYTEQTNINVDFQHSELGESLPPQVETAVFRIVQESLTNVSRYAGVDRVSVNIRTDDGMMRVEIADKGKGFDLKEARTRPSTGLGGMRERVELLGGQFQVETKPGKGTRIVAEIPISGDRIEGDTK